MGNPDNRPETLFKSALRQFLYRSLGGEELIENSMFNMICILKGLHVDNDWIRDY